MTIHMQILKNAQLSWPLWRTASWKSPILVGTDYDAHSYFAKVTQEWMFVGSFLLYIYFESPNATICSTYPKYSAAKAKVFQPLKL